ncbi:MAG: hypothetical protein QXQ18_02110 [Candidatus Aenigmatarchaeota archaeon]
MKKILILLIVISFIIIFSISYFSSAFKTPQKSEFEKAKEICIKECERALYLGQNLENGPCLLNPINDLLNWVCDVAHMPRQDVDNLPQNQCSAFREGKAKHFVEVSPSCEFIRGY